MTYLDELKEFSRLHIRSQRHPADLERTLATIDSEERDAPGGWTHQWSARASEYTRTGRALEAIQCLNFARFPFVSSQARANAHRACVERFAAWATSRDRRVKKVEISAMGHRVPVYTLIDRPGRPILIAIGGIVSIKEQWHALMFGAARLGFSVVIAECPGVGENPLPYTPGCHRFLGAILDELSGVTGRCPAYVVGLSFGGYLAIKQALCDPRIRGITTVGVPLSDFYTDAAWWAGVPEVTKRTLGHVCRARLDELPTVLAEFALSAGDLRSLAIPLHAVCSLRDEIVPQAEQRFLEANADQLDLVVFDDVHGAVHHMPALQKYIVWSVLSQSGAPLSVVKAFVTLNVRVAMLARRMKRVAAAGMRRAARP
jgi:pimeloyl-ACP methyl ester carboxylesterase